MAVPLRYLESLDSTRFSAEPAKNDDARLIHAEVELLLSWLFGQTVAVPEPYSVDSTGFLQIAADVLSVRPLTRRGRVQPFHLGVRSTATNPDESARPVTFLDRASALFRSSMVLTGWPTLQADPSARSEFADALQRRDSQQRRDLQAAAKVVTTEPERQNVARLQDLEDYFEPGQRYTVTPDPLMLPRFIGELRTFPPLLLEKEYLARAQSLKRAIDDLLHLKVDLSNRSDVRLAEPRYMDLPTASSTAFSDVIDFVDTAYNMVLRRSLGAHSAIYTSREYERPGFEFVGELCARRIERRVQVVGIPGTPSEKPVLVFKPLPPDLVGKAHVPWGPVWDLVESGTFLESLRTLQAATAAYEGAESDDDRARLREPLQHHIDKHVRLVAGVAHPYVLTTRGPWLQVVRNLPARLLALGVPGASAAGVGGAVEVLFQAMLTGGVTGAGVAAGALGGAAAAAAAALITQNPEETRIEGVVQTFRHHVRIR
jgi:hypothetical protein